MAVNECSFIGNLGADPETRSFQNGDKVTNLRLAVSERWTDKNTGEKRERTEWVPVAIFGSLANVAAQYLRKGSKVYVRGKMQTRKWQDQSGTDRYTTEIVLQGYDAKLEMLGDPQGGGDRQPRSGAPAGGAPSGGAPGFDEGDIPFHMEARA